MTTRTLTFKSINLGENVNFMLCFASSSVNQVANSSPPSPIAWRVTTLSAEGPSEMIATYANNLAFATAEVDGGSFVRAQDYVPISPGQRTTLRMNRSVTPPIQFEGPISIPGMSMEAKNGTGQATNIALGYIENLDENDESMEPILVYKNIGSSQSVRIKFEPIVRAYVNVNYSQKQALRADIQHASLVWEENLLDMEPSTTFRVFRNKTGDISVERFSAVLPELQVNFEQVYSATLAFSSADQVVPSVKTLSSKLISSGYFIKFISKEGSTDANLELALPPGTSCDQAENELRAALDVQAKPGERACIRSHGAARKVSTEESFAQWVDISPATNEWYAPGNNPSMLSPVTGDIVMSGTYRGHQARNRRGVTNGHLTIDAAGSRATKNRSRAVSPGPA